MTEQYSYCDLLCLRRISYRPRRRKLPSVCWQLPGRFRYPRSIYAVASYTATRVIYGTTGLAFSLRDHILPPGRPLCGSLIILKSGVMACEAMLLSASSVSRWIARPFRGSWRPGPAAFPLGPDEVLLGIPYMQFSRFMRGVKFIPSYT